MRYIVRGVVYNICEKLRSYKTAVYFQRKIMERHVLLSSSSMQQGNDSQNSGSGFHRLDSKKNGIDSENITSASKINNNLGGEQRRSSTKEQPMIFYFDLETSGLEVGCDILQISVRSGDSHFSTFVLPTQPIDIGASRVNNLFFRNGELYKGNEIVETLPLNEALEDMVNYLAKFNKKCVLVAHNCPFDSRHLLRKLEKNPILFERFKKSIYGFVDSLEMFRDKYPERRWKKGSLTLSRLVEENLGESTAAAHDARMDTFLLERLVQHHFEEELILHYRVTLSQALEDRKYWPTIKKPVTPKK